MTMLSIHGMSSTFDPYAYAEGWLDGLCGAPEVRTSSWYSAGWAIGHEEALRSCQRGTGDTLRHVLACLQAVEGVEPHEAHAGEDEVSLSASREPRAHPRTSNSGRSIA